MATCQLNVRVEVALARRLRQTAKAQHITPGVLVAQALELLLAGNSKSPAPALSTDSKPLLAALAALEQRVEALERGHAPEAQPAPKQGPLQWDGHPLPDRRLTPAEAEGLFTLPQVAEALGLGGGGSAITNWIAREARKLNGEVPLGAVYRGWRLRGKGLLPGGQKPGWLWEAAAG